MDNVWINVDNWWAKAMGRLWRTTAALGETRHWATNEYTGRTQVVFKKKEEETEWASCRDDRFNPSAAHDGLAIILPT